MILRHFLQANFFMFILLISNHTVFLVQSVINLHFELFKKLKLHSPKWAVEFQFMENSLVQINSKLNKKNRMITFSNGVCNKITRVALVYSKKCMG